MLRSIIEFFRREAGLSILDLTTDICSSSMYYFYIRGENLTPKKVQALKEVLGSDQLTEEEIAQFDHEISALIDEFLGYRYSLNALTMKSNICLIIANKQCWKKAGNQLLDIDYLPRYL